MSIVIHNSTKLMMQFDRADNKNAGARVLKSVPECMKLIFEYQDGVHLDLRERFQERFKPIYTWVLWNQQYKWPIDCRPLGCLFEDRIFPMSELYLHKGVRDRRFALHLAIAEGKSEIVRRIWHMHPSLVTEDAFKCAVRFNQVEMLDWFFPFVGEKSRMRFYIFPFEGTDHSCKEIVQKKTLEKLIELGSQVPNVRLTNDRVVSYFASVCDDAALEHFYDIVGSRLSTEILMSLLFDVIERKHEALVDRLIQDINNRRQRVETGWPGNPDVMYTIALSKKLKWIQAVMNYLNGEGSQLMFHGALMESTNVEVLDWLKETYNPEISEERFIDDFNDYTSESIQWLTTNYASTVSQPLLAESLYVPFVEWIKVFHATGQSLQLICPSTVDVARYLVEHGVIFTKNNITGAIRHFSQMDNRESLEAELNKLVKYIHEAFPNIEIDGDTLEVAAQYGTVEVLRYLYEHSAVGRTYNTLDKAMKSKILAKIKYLREERGFEWSFTGLQDALESKSLDLVKYLVEWDKDGVINAVLKLETITFTSEILQYLVDELPICGAVLLPAMVECGDYKYVCKIMDNEHSLARVATAKQVIFKRAIDRGEVQILECLWSKLVECDRPLRMSAYEKSYYLQEIAYMKERFPFSGPWDQFLFPTTS